MLHDARGALAADHPLVHRVVAIALDIFDRAVFQIDFDAATAGTHVARGRLDLVPGLERGVDLGFGHSRHGTTFRPKYMMEPDWTIGSGACDNRSQPAHAAIDH